MTPHPVAAKIAEHLAQLEAISSRSIDVAGLEPVLRQLLGYLKSVGRERGTAEEALLTVVDEWPLGGVEALEFTMRELRWEAVRHARVDQVASDADFRLKDQARRVLEVFEPEWPNGEIYESYRDS